jgi:hypothetical protein
MKNSTPILMLVTANVLFAIIPLFIGELRQTSTFTLAFFRFFGAALIEMTLSGLILLHLHKKLRIHDPRLTIGRFIRRVLKNYYTSSNLHFFRGKPQWFYMVMMGFLLIDLSIPSYFLSFNLAGLVISTIMVNGCTLIIIALLNWIKKAEHADLLRVMDIILLIAAIFTIGFSRLDMEIAPIPPEGFIALLITITSYTLFLIGIGADISGKIPVTGFNLSLLPRGKDLQKEALLLKAVLKLATMHIAGIVLMFPFTFFLKILVPSTVYGQIAIQFLDIELHNFFQILLNPAILALIILGSIIPYFCIVYSAIIWPRHGLTHDGWASILTLLDPLIGMYIGYMVWLEPLRSDYILFTTIFLLAGLVIRYFHGTANARRFIFVVKLKPRHYDQFLSYIRGIIEIIQINQTLGTYDAVLRVSVQNIARLEQIANHINLYPGLEKAYYSIETSHL